MTLTLDAIKQARERIAGYVRHTPILPPPSLRGDMPAQLRLKLENLQVSGSFKARGVFNNLLQLDDEQRKRGVIAASGGNHGAALAYGAWRLGIPATIFLTKHASADRIARVAAWGAEVVQHGDIWDEANSAGIERAAETGATYIHPFDAECTLEGQGTLGLELLDDAPDMDCVLIAIGGGGLIAGIAMAIKETRPNVRVIGVEPVGSAAMRYAVERGEVAPLLEVRTIADTLAPRAVAERTLRLTERYVDDIETVTDAEMIAAMRWLWTDCNQLVEPAGAAVIAAIQNSAVDAAAYRRPVALICGGNAAVDSVFAAYEASL